MVTGDHKLTGYCHSPRIWAFWKMMSSWWSRGPELEEDDSIQSSTRSSRRCGLCPGFPEHKNEDRRCS